VQKNSGLCTLTAFKDWLAESRQVPFPVARPNEFATPGSDAAKTVHDLLAEFVRTDVGKKYASNVIFNYVPVEKKDISDKEKHKDGGGNVAASLPALRVKVMVFKFYSVERSYEGGFKAMESFRVWDEALAFVNDGAPASAGAAFHTSELWTRAVTEVIAVTGTLTGVSLVLVSSFLVVWLFTSSVRAAMLCTVVLVAVLTITSGLFWLFGWELGIVEAVGISILLGAAVDYPAHVIERFIEAGHVDTELRGVEDRAVGGRPGSPPFRAVVPRSHFDGGGEVERDGEAEEGEHTASWNQSQRSSTRGQGLDAARLAPFDEKRQRVIASLTSVGVSVLNASATTVMSCFVLIFCTVQIFQKVGVIMLTASAVSIAATVVPLPAVLAKCGPKPFARTLRRRVVSMAMVLGAALGVLVLAAVVNQATGGVLWS
jgi:hypothetical protein